MMGPAVELGQKSLVQALGTTHRAHVLRAFSRWGFSRSLGIPRSLGTSAVAVRRAPGQKGLCPMWVSQETGEVGTG